MRTWTWMAAALVGIASGAYAEMGGAAAGTRTEMLSVVQITDMQGQVGFEIKTREEMAALQKELKDETAVFAAAVADSKKEWESNKDNKLPFQGSRIKPRSAKKVGADFTERDKADKKRSQIEERVSNKQLEDEKKSAKTGKQGKGKEEDTAKEEARTKAFNEAYAMISKRMADKLGRPVPGYGFAGFDEKKDAAKKEEPKKEEKKDKKDDKKDKKEEKK